MRILVACEFSGIVRDAFRAQGHDAISCDILPSERPGPHYQGDVRDILSDVWDMLIGFPPCTYLSAAGAHLWKRRANEIKEAAAFFQLLYNAPIHHVAIENPQGWMNSHWRRPDQTIHPYMFGEPWKKRTCLWLRELPALHPSGYAPEPYYPWVDTGYNYRRYGSSYAGGAHRNPRDRARTFQGIADAMAAQWEVLS